MNNDLVLEGRDLGELKNKTLVRVRMILLNKLKILLIHTITQEVTSVFGELLDFNALSKHLPGCSVDALLFKSE